MTFDFFSSAMIMIQSCQPTTESFIILIDVWELDEINFDRRLGLLCLPSSTAAESFIDVTMEKSFKQSSQLVGEVIRQFNILLCGNPKSKSSKKINSINNRLYILLHLCVIHSVTYIHYITQYRLFSLFLSFIINRASIPLHRRMHEYISVGGLLACTHTVSQFRSKWAISLSAFEMSR